jgi:hypothetical protein
MMMLAALWATTLTLTLRFNVMPVAVLAGLLLGFVLLYKDRPWLALGTALGIPLGAAAAVISYAALKAGLL